MRGRKRKLCFVFGLVACFALLGTYIEKHRPPRFTVETNISSQDTGYILDEDMVNKSGKININTADKAVLEQLDGIGEKMAGRIISYREENGPFLSIEEITKVSGIGDKLFERIKNDITVE